MLKRGTQLQYIVVDFTLSESTTGEREVDSLSLCQLRFGDSQFRSEMKIAKQQYGQYVVTFEGQTIEVASFELAWIHCLKWSENHFIFLFDRNEKEQLDEIAHLSGYLPISEDNTLFCSWLSGVLYPQLAQKDFSALFTALFPQDTSEHSHVDMRVEVAKVLIERLRALPSITLHFIQTATLGTAVSRIAEFLLSVQETREHTTSRMKVIEDLAFTAINDEVVESTTQTPHRISTGDLASKSLETLRTQFKEMGSFPYEIRQGQEHMMELVATALDTDSHLIVEAGTGTGKSLAYLLPSALFAKTRGEKVVIATHTIALQEQLHKHDVPLVLEPLLHEVASAVLKGRNNYICMRKLNHNVHEIQTLPLHERDFDLRLAVWLTDTATGDREEIAFTEREEFFWRDVASDTNSCMAKHCSFFRDCYYFRARHKAAKSDLILTNHSLVLSDIKADSRVLPAYDRLIIDEAHQFEEVATKQLGAEITESDLHRLLERLLNARNGLLHDAERTIQQNSQNGSEDGQAFAAIVNKLGRALLRTAQDVKTLFHTITKYTNAVNISQGEWRLTHERTGMPAYDPVIRAATDINICQTLLAEASSAYAILSEDAELPDSLHRKIADLFGYARELQQGITICADVLLLRLSPDQFVGWIGVNTKRDTRRISLHLAPLSVSDVLLQELFRKKQSVVLTSATIAVANSFHYFLDRIGMNQLVIQGKAKTEIVSSPFDYKRQALLCVVTDLPDSKQQNEFQSAIGKAITDIATTANGRTLVLFTSHQMLIQTYHSERQRMQERGITVLAQGFDDHRKTYLIETFRRADRAVLFGVNSFWEGIDIRGNDLSCLVIVKLPFAVPTHPIVEARSELLVRLGKRPFIDYSVPAAVIRFTQGFGRLIRSKTDRGAVFVLDKRITQTRYGRMFIRSLPDPQVVEGTLQETCSQALKFFEPTQYPFTHQ